MTKHVGFTGTRHGMTPQQVASTYDLLHRIVGVTHAHHGDCVGADADFHAMATRLQLWRVGHLPVDETHRAFCAFDEVRSPLKHMQRNKAIVVGADVMIACPFDAIEKSVGGTWKTVGFTRKAGKPLAIVWPSGDVTTERWA